MKTLLSKYGVWIASAGMLGVALAAIALAVTMPIPVEVADGQLGGPSSGKVVTAAGLRISPEQWEHDTARQLQQPLVNAPAATQDAPVVVPAAPLPPLVGTIVEPGQSLALLDVPGAGISFKHVGESIADARIVAIDVTGITVFRQGQTVYIRAAAPPPTAAIPGAKAPILGTGTASTARGGGT